MKICKYAAKLIIILLIGVGISTAEDSIPEKGATSPMRALELYCENNFIGEINDARYLYGIGTSKQELLEKWPLDIDSDPIVIVSTYYIVGVQSNSNSGSSKVVFERLAYTHGDGSDVTDNPAPRVIIPEYNESEEVEYKLKNIDGRWYVYDPPPMRVSLAAVNKYYFKQATSFLPDNFWIDPKLSNEQRRNHAKMFSDIGIIMQISVEYLKKLEKRYDNLGGPGYPEKERRQRVKGGYNGKWNLEIVPEGK